MLPFGSLTLGIDDEPPTARVDAVRQRPCRVAGRTTMVEIFGSTFAQIDEIQRGYLVRRIDAWRVVVDIAQVEDGVRLWLDDGSTLTLGATGLVEAAR
jgi:hypothetical protein